MAASLPVFVVAVAHGVASSAGWGSRDETVLSQGRQERWTKAWSARTECRMTTQIQLPLGGNTATLPATGVGSSRSPHSGRELRELVTEVTISSEAAANVKEAFCAGEPVTDTDGAQWMATLENESWSGLDDGPHRLTIRWREHETVQADAVEISDLVLIPTSYEERFDDDRLVISLRAQLTPAETDRLRDLFATGGRTYKSQEYHPVVRRGVSDQTIPMRFGRMLWQQHASGTEHEITLVAQEGDRPPDRLVRSLSG